MKMRLVMLLTFAATVTVAGADDRRFSAADVPAVKLQKSGRIVVNNTSTHITAYRFFGDIREALVSLRATRRVISRPFGDSRASARAVPAQYLPIISEAAIQHGVDPRLVAEVVRRESAFNKYAVSPVGASGLMQLMPATAKFLGVTDVFDARQNIFGGTRYLRTLLDTFNGDLNLALAAYNAGPGAVRKYKGIPPYRETKAYVETIRSNYERQLRSQPKL